ncbi:3',5'-cyclic-nucleotide phosphodiesterase [Lacisediminimonas profundi]|uniref:3',5'-cyclic-nucleotide phosphodiesterase n=1 Tax=Lacisediminimonas profundi TaxID=2603856 RepID=UPI00124B46DA|nr:3',5'-cyclic-nucleotide phosphodiesterase [Lacisediminimonas profundi]
MIVKVLGCSGGIGGRHLHTTSMLVDNDILIDAGTGVGELTIAELAMVDHVFLTHSHLDHICCLPFIVDTVGEMRNRPLVVYASKATEEIIRSHIFNWAIWPDFTTIPDSANPYMRFETVEVGDTVRLNGRKITVLPARHTVPAVGYQLDSGQGSLVFTGDTTVNDDFWRVVNTIPQLRYLIIETAFSNSERRLAELSKHLCPSMLANELQKLQSQPEIFITHLKPGQIELTMREIAEYIGDYKPRMLQNNHCFDF